MQHNKKTLQLIIGFETNPHNPQETRELSQEDVLAKIQRRIAEAFDSNAEDLEIPIHWLIALASEAVREALKDGEVEA